MKDFEEMKVDSDYACGVMYRLWLEAEDKDEFKKKWQDAWTDYEAALARGKWLVEND